MLSFLADRQADRPMEWDIRNGVIQRYGRKHGIAVPISDVVGRCWRRGARGRGELNSSFKMRGGGKDKNFASIPHKRTHWQTKTLRQRPHMIQSQRALSVKDPTHQRLLTNLILEIALSELVLIHQRSQ